MISPYLTQTLPTTDSGRTIYIYLGQTASAYQLILQPNHPVYHNVAGEIEICTGSYFSYLCYEFGDETPSGERGQYYFDCNKTGQEVYNFVNRNSPITTTILSDGVLSSNFEKFTGLTYWDDNRLKTIAFYDDGEFGNTTLKKIWIDDDRYMVADYGDIQGGVVTVGSGGGETSSLPKQGKISFSSTWSGSDPYTQTVTVSGATVTSNSKIDL